MPFEASCRNVLPVELPPADQVWMASTALTCISERLHLSQAVTLPSLLSGSLGTLQSISFVLVVAFDKLNSTAYNTSGASFQLLTLRSARQLGWW